MSLSRATVHRLPEIKAGLRGGLTHPQIGKRCGVTEKTIDRDMHSWVESGFFEVWLKEEFVDLHHYARDTNPMEAYKEISKIVGRMVTRKAEFKTEIKKDVTVQVDINSLLRKYEATIQKTTANGNIHEDNSPKQVHPTQTHG